MKINVSCHHLDLTDPIKQYVEEKMQKIKHHFDNVIIINVILEVEKNIQIAEGKVHVSGVNIFSKVENSDMYLAIDKMVNKLDAQIIKHKEKITSHRG